MSNLNDWWAYLHINNSVQVKRYFCPVLSNKEMSWARESDFVQRVYGPFKAKNRNHAIALATAFLE